MEPNQDNKKLVVAFAEELERLRACKDRLSFLSSHIIQVLPPGVYVADGHVVEVNDNKVAYKEKLNTL